MSRLHSTALAAVFAVLSLCLALPTHALAHESRDVAAGKYQMVVGFLVEPAYEAQKNGLDLRVRVPGTPATPVTGLEKTLQVEIIHAGTGKTVTKPIRAISATTDPGHYTADVLPTQPGQYKFRVFGMVETTSVNETFTSGDKFGNVQPISELSLPDTGGTRSLEASVKDLEHAAADATAAASSARTMAIVALGVAAIAIVSAGALAMRKR